MKGATVCQVFGEIVKVEVRIDEQLENKDNDGKWKLLDLRLIIYLLKRFKHSNMRWDQNEIIFAEQQLS